MMQKQNDSRYSSKCFSPRNSSSSHPSLPFIDTLGSSPVNLSNAGRNSMSLRKRHENWNQITEKGVPKDPKYEVFPPLLLGELTKQSNILIEGLETVLKSLESDFKPNIGSTRSHRNKSDEITSAGDVDRNAVECPALWAQLSPRRGNHTTPDAKQAVANKPENKSDMLKEKLNHLLDCAFKIKNAIPAELQYPHSGNADNLHMPTGAMMTPTTQTEPVDTYVKFLQVIDEGAGFSSERTDSRNRSGTRNETSPGRARMRINRTRTVDTTGHQQKWRSTKTDRRSSNYSLNNVLSETLNRNNIPNLPQNRKSPKVDVTVAEVMNDHCVEEGVDKELPKTSEKSQANASSLNRRSEKIARMPSADTITITQTDEKHFSLTDYISALKQVNVRSPATRRVREFSIRSKTYFDFDDYYEKLINMHNDYQMITDSVNSYHLKQL